MSNYTVSDEEYRQACEKIDALKQVNDMLVQSNIKLNDEKADLQREKNEYATKIWDYEKILKEKGLL